MFEPTEQEKRQFLLLILFSLVLTGWFYATDVKSHTLDAFVPPGRASFGKADVSADQLWLDPKNEFDKADPSKVLLNVSPREDLLECPGIGPSFADRILEERRQGGPFSSWEDLRNRVSGLGPVKIDTLKQAGVQLGP